MTHATAGPGCWRFSIVFQFWYLEQQSFEHVSERHGWCIVLAVRLSFPIYNSFFIIQSSFPVVSLKSLYLTKPNVLSSFFNFEGLIIANL